MQIIDCLLNSKLRTIPCLPKTNEFISVNKKYTSNDDARKPIQKVKVEIYKKMVL